MPKQIRKTVATAATLVVVLALSVATISAQTQAPAPAPLTDAQVQALYQALLAQGSGAKLTPAQAQLLAQYLAYQSQAAAAAGAAAANPAQSQALAQALAAQGRSGAAGNLSGAQALMLMQGMNAQGQGAVAPNALGAFPQNAVAAGGVAPQAPLGAKKPGVIRIGVVQPKAQMGQGNSGANVAEPIRNTIVQYLTGPAQEVVPLGAMIPTQIEAEATSKQCDYILYSSIAQKIGGGGFSMLKKVGSMSSMVPGVGMMTGSMTGAMTAAAASSVMTGAASAASTVKAKSDVTFEYKLIAPGADKPLVANTEKVKAKEDGEDVITPLIEQAATAILDTITKAKK
jgi:hypothetical protein